MEVEQESKSLISREFKVSELIEEVGFGPFHLLLFVLLGFTYMTEACETMLLTFLLPEIQEKWSLSPFKESLLGCFVFCGSIMWGGLADRYGRKWIVFLMTCFTAFFGVAVAFSPNYYVLGILLLCSGVGIGGINTPFALFMEWLPLKYRGIFLVLLQLWWAAGTIYVAFLAWLILPLENELPFGNWRWFLGFSALPAVIVVSFLPFLCPESPRYLALSGRLKSLKKLFRFAEIMNRCKRVLPRDFSVVGIDKFENKNSRARLRDLFKRGVFWVFINMCLINITSCIGYYGISLSTVHFFSVGGDKKAICMGALFSSLAELSGILFVVFFVNFVGRKSLQVYGRINVAIGLLGLFFGNSVFGLEPFAVQIILACFIRMNQSTAYSVSWINQAESVPTNIRAFAVGSSLAAGKFINIFSPFISEMLEFPNYPGIPLVIYAAVSSLCAFFTSIHVETRSKQLVETIEQKEDAPASSLIN